MCHIAIRTQNRIYSFHAAARDHTCLSYSLILSTFGCLLSKFRLHINILFLYLFIWKYCWFSFVSCPHVLSGHPAFLWIPRASDRGTLLLIWIPAFAGMTKRAGFSQFITSKCQTNTSFLPARLYKVTEIIY